MHCLPLASISKPPSPHPRPIMKPCGNSSQHGVQADTLLGILGINERACPATRKHSLQAITFIAHMFSPHLPSPPRPCPPRPNRPQSIRTRNRYFAMGRPCLRIREPVHRNRLGLRLLRAPRRRHQFLRHRRGTLPKRTKKVNPSPVDFHVAVPPRGRIV